MGGRAFDPAACTGGQAVAGVGQRQPYAEGVARGIDHLVDVGHARQHRAGLWQLGRKSHRVAGGDAAPAAGRHHEFNAQRVEHGQAQQRLVLGALARADEALDDDAVEGAFQRAQPELRFDQAPLVVVDDFLCLGLQQLLFGHVALGLRLLQCLRARKALLHQADGARVALLRQRQVGLSSADVGVLRGARAGGLEVGFLDLALQLHQHLPAAHAVATVHRHRSDDTGDGSTDVGHRLRADQAAHGGARWSACCPTRCRSWACSGLCRARRRARR